MLLKENGWSLHSILNQNFNPTEGIGAFEQSENSWLIYLPEEDLTTASNYTETAVTDFPITSGFGTTVADYPELSFETGGATWNLNKLRAGGFIATAFTEAFVVVTKTIIIQVADGGGDEPSDDCPFKDFPFLGVLLCFFWNLGADILAFISGILPF